VATQELLVAEGMTTLQQQSIPKAERRVFTTDRFRPSDRVGAFQNTFGTIWGSVNVRSQNETRFFSQFETTRLCGLRFNHITLQSMAFRRHRAAGDQIEPFVSLALPRSGQACITRGSKEYVFSPGSLYMIRHGDPDLTAVSDHYRTENIQIPLHMLEQRLVRMPEYFQLPLSPGGCGRVLEHFIMGLWSELPHIRPQDEAMLVNQMCDLLARTLSTTREISGTEAARLRNQRSDIVNRLESMLADPQLSPLGIAQSLGMSVSHLHRIFASGGASVMAEVRALRLRRASELLAARAHRHAQIAEIARVCGFSSQQDFARVFRQQCGMSPSQFRRENGEISGGETDSKNFSD